MRSSQIFAKFRWFSIFLAPVSPFFKNFDGTIKTLKENWYLLLMRRRFFRPVIFAIKSWKGCFLQRFRSNLLVFTENKSKKTLRHRRCKSDKISVYQVFRLRVNDSWYVFPAKKVWKTSFPIPFLWTCNHLPWENFQKETNFCTRFHFLSRFSSRHRLQNSQLGFVAVECWKSVIFNFSAYLKFFLSIFDTDVSQIILSMAHISSFFLTQRG